MLLDAHIWKRTNEISIHILAANHLGTTLNENDTLWLRLCCGRCTSAFGIIENINIRFLIYLIIFAGLELTGTFVKGIWNLFVNILATILLMSVILDCNEIVFIQAMKSFRVYYSTINIIISILAFNIDYHFWVSIDSQQYTNDFLYTKCFFSVLKNGLLVFTVCILDGYKIQRYSKTLTCICVLYNDLIVYWFLSCFKYTSYNATGTIFNQSFHWHTCALSTLSSAAFIIMQCYLQIRYPTKIALLPAFIPFEFVTSPKSGDKNSINKYNDKNSEYELNEILSKPIANIVKLTMDHDDTSARALSWNVAFTPIKIYKQKTLLYFIVNTNICKCLLSDKMMNRILRILSSKYVVLGCIIPWTVYLLIAFVYELEFDGTVMILLYNLLNTALWVVTLNFNTAVTKYNLSTFNFWWKMQDTIVYCVILDILFYQDDLYWWRTDTVAQSSIITILTFIFVPMYVFVIANSKALIISKYMTNIIIAVGIVLKIGFAITFFLSPEEYSITLWKNSNFFVSDMELSCRTLLITKNIDVAIFFGLQLYCNLRHGTHGVSVRGYVNVDWTTSKIQNNNISINTRKSISIYGKNNSKQNLSITQTLLNTNGQIELN